MNALLFLLCIVTVVDCEQQLLLLQVSSTLLPPTLHPSAPSVQIFMTFYGEMVRFGWFLYADFENIYHCFVVDLKRVFK